MASTDGGSSRAAVAAGKHPIVPLPFDSAKLKGLSERLLRSHHENNYGGAVKNLNKVEEELARVNKDTPGFLVGGSRSGSSPSTTRWFSTSSTSRTSEATGTRGTRSRPRSATPSGASVASRKLFRAVGMSLAGGSGWAVLDQNSQSGQLGIHWSSNHTQAAAYSEPLLVMDMYEHAYAHRLRRSCGEVHRRILPEHSVG
jgi:Fe-Mn family superoxide dismutase